MGPEEQNIIQKQIKAVIIVVLLLGLFLLIANYHIVIDANDLSKEMFLIKRPYFGFSDIVGSIKTCTEAPNYSVTINHPSLCKALQEANYLESEESRNRRIESEVIQKMQLDKLQLHSECLKTCEAAKNNIDSYLSCTNNCGQLFN